MTTFTHVEVLTVEKGKAFSHRNKGWEEFTDAILHTLVQMKVRCLPPLLPSSNHQQICQVAVV